MRTLPSYCAALFLSCLFVLSGSAQGFVYDAGSPAYSVNIPIENGFINVANGNLHMEIHLANHPQRGALSLDEKLVYDSHFWEIGHYSNYYWWPDNVPRTSQMAMGWRFVTGAETGTISPAVANVSSYGCMNDNDQPGTVTTNNYTYSWQAPDGTKHTFANGYSVITRSTCSGISPQSETSSGPATDSSGYTITLNGTDHTLPTDITVRDVHGTQVYPQIIDRYGNYWSSDSNGNLVDDRGQTPVLVSSSGSQVFYDVLAPGGGRARYTVNTTPFNVSTQFGQQAVNEYSGSLPSVSSIQLPDGSSYNFSYDSQFGELNNVTLPTGGSIAYGWTTFFDSYQNANRWVTSRTVGSNPAMTFTPSVVTQCSSGGTGCQEKMVVHEPGGNETAYNLTLNNGAWNTNTQRFSGAASGGTLLTSTDTAYDFSNPCTPSCVGADYVSATSTTTTLADVGLKLTDTYAYTDETLGLLQSKWRYDFYSGSLPSKPSFVQEWGYGGTVPGDVTAMATRDGNRNILSFETRSYGAASSTTSGLPQHGTANAAGSFLTAVGEWVNTDGSYVSTSYQTDDAGTVTAVSTPYTGPSPTNWRTMGHDATDTFPTSTNEPSTTSGVALSSSAGFDGSSGVPTSSTDYNAQTTSLKNYDWLGRVGEVDAPDGGQVKYTYAPTSRITTSKVDNNQTESVVEATDEVGRPSRTAVGSGQNATPWYQQDTCYNANGQVQGVSLPYAGTGFNMAKQCSGTTYTYEAMGRPSTVTNADGTTHYYYTGRATEIVDVNGKAKITQVDGLGRLMSVCEVTSQSQAGVAPVNCGMDIAGTGFLTTYSYDITNHITYTVQGNQSRGVQVDSLGRTVSTTEPERGNTTYTYAYNGNGLIVNRVRPMANQTNPSVTTTMTTQYDALNRPIDVKYQPTSGSSTDYTVFPEAYFSYDAVDSNSPIPSTNTKGRLTIASNYPGTGLTAFDRYNYDSMGRLAQSFECMPGWCSAASRSMIRTYGHDYAGNKTTETWANGAQNVTMTYTYTVASELDTMSGGNNDGAMPLFPYFYKAVTHTPNGTSSEQYGNGLYGNRIYDAMGRLQGQWECIGTTTPGCGDAAHHVEGYLNFITGNRVNRLVNVMGDFTMGYDDLGRMTSMTTTGGSTPTLSWTYDRYGNRLTQNDIQNVGLPNRSYTYTANNRIYTSTGSSPADIQYDAAGNLTQDGPLNQGFHKYIYDEAGNVRCVDSCGTTSDLFDAFNRRVFHVVGNDPAQVYRYEHNDVGQESDVWLTDNAPVEHAARYYANGQPFAFWSSDGKVHFNHADYINTSHARTNDVGQREATFYSLPFGDAYSTNGSDGQDQHFADLDRDGESYTEHATYRAYSSVASRWMQPDPYDGSYDPTDPQSFNRYNYTLNNPMSFMDPSGQNTGCSGATINGQYYGSCVDLGSDGSSTLGSIISAIVSGVEDIFGFGHPHFKGSLHSRPVTATSNPCANSTLSAARVNIRSNLAATDLAVSAGYTAGSSGASGNPVGGAAGALFSFYLQVHTGGPQDVKNQPGPGYQNQVGIDAGNINYGVVCPFGATGCQAAAGIAQAGSGLLNIISEGRFGHGRPGPASTYFDSPSDNTSIKQGQSMRAAGCHE